MTDPRIEAVAKACWLRDGRADASDWERLPPATRERWKAEACVPLAAADAVDPLRQPSRLDRIEALYADPEGWPEP